MFMKNEGIFTIAQSKDNFEDIKTPIIYEGHEMFLEMVKYDPDRKKYIAYYIEGEENRDEVIRTIEKSKDK